MVTGEGAVAGVSFEHFVAESAHALLRLASVVAADAATAQDVVQSVLERAYRDWVRIAALDNPAAYVRRMVTNEALSTRRRMARVVLTDSFVDQQSAVDEMNRVGEVEDLVLRLRGLPARQRAAVALRYLYDLPDAEIARHLGCREVSVRGYVFRALHTLRLGLTDEPGATIRPTAAARPYPEAT